jgi:hypothetical protein
VETLALGIGKMSRQEIETWWDDDVLTGEIMVHSFTIVLVSALTLSLICHPHLTVSPRKKLHYHPYQHTVTPTNHHHGATTLLHPLWTPEQVCIDTTTYEEWVIQLVSSSRGMWRCIVGGSSRRNHMRRNGIGNQRGRCGIRHSGFGILQKICR